MPSPGKRQLEESVFSVKKRLRSQENNNNDPDENETFPAPSSTVESDTKDGIIQWITVKNFMCHDHLHFEFSPHINFVQGRNGSGKSAILTGIVVGLGGTARFTNRGNSIKELVKHGKQVATIEIGIKNSGKTAFKSNVYGKSIVVERKIMASGGGGYKVKAWDGTVVSAKKDELSRMLEHFNLQVDNPVTILNQDMSRSFFNTTDPKVLFKFFMEATQMQQMKDDYDKLEQTIQTSLKIVESRRALLPELEKEVEEQRDCYQFSLLLREKGKKLKELRHELAWAKIIQHEKNKADAEKVLEKHGKNINSIKEKIEHAQKVIEEQAEMGESKAKLLREATEHLSEISGELRKKNAEIRTVKNEYKERQFDFNVAEKKVRQLSKEIATLQAAIEKDNSRAQSQWATERAEWQRKMREVQDQIKEVIDILSTENTHHQNLWATDEAKTVEKTHLEMEEKALRKQMNDLERELKGLQSQKGSQLTVYGQWVPQLLNKIDIAFSKGLFSKKPVGPMGAYIKVKDTKWAHVAERVLGRRITSFCVNSQADEQVLRKLMKEMNLDQQPIVTVAKFRDKVLDVSKFEAVSSVYPSLWATLDISNTVVANTVIDLMQVESILLIPTSQEAGKLLKDKNLVPKNCKCAYTLKLDQYYPDPNYRVYSGRGSQHAKFLQVSVEDKIREINETKEECKERHNLLKPEIQKLQSELRTVRDEMNASNKKSQHHKRKLETLRMTMTSIQNQEPPAPPDIAELEDDVKRHETDLEKAKAEMEKVRDAVLEMKTKYTELSGGLLELRQMEKNAHKKVEEHQADLEQSSANNIRVRIQTWKNQEKALQKEEKDLVRAVREAATILGEAVQAVEACNFGERIETKRSVKDLERQYSSLQARLNKERASSGNPLTITEKYMATKQRYKEVSDELNTQTSLLKKLNESLAIREKAYWRFHKWLAVIVKYFFKEHLSVRKLQGSISINLEEKTLNIHVEKPGPVKQSPVKESKAKKRKSKIHQELIMMSGGERSFATVAFIIALWHTIVAPVRFLDEFDVFMDVIARNHAMKMMISAAKTDTQYIFLTPLSLDTSKLKNCVFFKMPDPERNEETS